jgi:cob(I)alamin adenosyltransferase
MKIYTKKGDKGKTSLIGGKRVFKNNPQVDAYGTIDELIANIGLVRSSNINNDYIKKEYKFNIHDYDIKKILLEIQNKLMICACNVAKEKGKDIKLPSIKEDDVVLLEKWIDEMNDKLPKLKSFILPSGTVVSSLCHVSRTVCRRAERLTIGISEDNDYDMVIKYLNRLSDFLFVLARLLNYEKEDLWIQKKGE